MTFVVLILSIVFGVIGMMTYASHRNWQDYALDMKAKLVCGFHMQSVCLWATHSMSQHTYLRRISLLARLGSKSSAKTVSITLQ